MAEKTQDEKDAEARAKAAADAQKTVADAQEQAKKIVADARAEAAKFSESREQHIADAREEADKIIADAQAVAARVKSAPVAAPVVAQPLYNEDGVTVLSAVGIIGGPFAIYGSGLGAQKNVTIDGQNATLTSVRNDHIKGGLPVGIEAGKQRVQMGNISFDMVVG